MNEFELNETQRLAIYLVQREVLERAIRGDGLVASMEVLCRGIEQILEAQGGLCSILLLEEQHLRHCAAPSLPQPYCKAIDGVTIGERTGSCGTALFRREQVVVTDIATDPLWEDYRELALAHGLGACWSNPIIASDQTVLASFAIYYPEPRSPSDFHRFLIEAFSALGLLVIDHYRLAEQQTRLSGELQTINARLTTIMQVIPDEAFVLDHTGRYVDFFGNSSQLPVPPETLSTQSVSSLFEPQLAEQIMRVIETTLATKQMQVLEYEIYAEGRRIVFEGRTAVLTDSRHDAHRSHSGDQYVLWMARDITARKQAEDEATRLALFDVLTGLPNRRHAQEELEQLLEAVGRNHTLGAVIFLDIDDFKRINDSLGHDQGDSLLKQVADRLESSTRRSEMVARLGGDEFVVLLREPLTDADALVESVSATARRILGCFKEPLAAQGHAYNVSTSLGIALIDQPGLKTEDLLRKADAAMYAAKRLGGNRFTFFEESLQQEANRRLELERRMVQAIKDLHFSAWFQPQVRPDGAPFGAEVLLRWLDPEEGAIPPDEFIPIAERSGLIHQLQDIVLEQSCQMLSCLQEKNLLPPEFRLAINISPVQFKERTLTERLSFFIGRYGLNPERFTLEITEGLLMDQQQEAHQQMQCLRQQGFQFAIDDFGTGYSSLAYLHRLPVDQLKIDKSFVRELEEEDTGEAIVDSVIALSKNLNFEVVAEGVETRFQSDILCAKALSSLQGFFYARPMPGVELVDYLKKALRSAG
ncbi:MAG: EAL domain [Marinobacter excellens HL-55]|uniref:EAL domain n=1 Tax=Marinobacter excellens HL-55 TaxID=1305731 RepID=A0A0P7YZ06_9GAMM|nr:MAG: EAL domain [Marinobacter excellens HL-55]